MKLIDAWLIFLVISVVTFAFMCEAYEDRILALELERDSYLVDMINTEDVMANVFKSSLAVTDRLKKCEKRKKWND